MPSLLGDLVGSFLALFSEHPYLVLLVVLTLEEAGLPLPLPGDLLVLVAGAAVAGGHLSLLPAGACVVVAATTGAAGLYALGRLGGRPALARYGPVCRLTPTRVARLECWLLAHPSAVVWSRLVPGLRIITSFAAGTLRLPGPIFLLATSGSALLWATLYLALGALVGPAASELARQASPSLALPGLALALALVVWTTRHRTRRRLA